MDPAKADDIAQAFLKPDARTQEVLRRQREAHERDLERRRMTAMFVLPGMLLGAIVAHYVGFRFSWGIIYGGLVGALVGWGVVAWRRRQSASTATSRDNDTTS